MLDMNPEIICNIIAKAREFHAQEGVTFPDDSPESYDYTDWMQVLAAHKDDLTYQEVTEAINDLEPDQQITLVALMYLGRGDFEWKEALQEARDGWTTHTAEYLLSHPLVADYLQEGLALKGYSCEA
jgi:hypothetical protein